MKSINFTVAKLEKELKEFKSLDEAEEFVRSYPLCLKDKIEILRNNETINELRDNYQSKTTKNKIKKV